MRRWPLFFVLFSFSVLLAQDASRIAARRADLETAKDDTARALALSDLGFDLIYSQPDSAHLCMQQALEMAERLGSNKAIATARINLAWYETKTGHDERSEKLSLSALDAARLAGDARIMATVLSVRAVLAEQRGDLTLALSLQTSTLQQWEVLGEEGPMAIALYNIGRLYMDMNEPDRARDLFARALEIQTAAGNRNSQGNCLLMIGNTWKRVHQPEKARQHYDEAFTIFQELESHRGMGLVEENRGALFAEGAPALAYTHLQRALEHYAILGNNADRAYVLREIAKVQISTKDLLGAEKTLQEGRGLLAEGQEADLLRDYELALADLEKKLGKPQEALDAYIRYMALKDSSQSAASRRELIRLRTEFETERAEKDNEILRAKDLESMERLRARNLQLYGSLALAALALGAVVLVWRNLQQRRKYQIVLESLNADLQDKQARIEEINGLLRLRVLRTQMDPHFIHNCLNAIKALSLAGEHTRAEEYLDGFARLLRQVLEHSVRDRITLEEELDFLRNYVKLEGLRMKGEFARSIEADAELIDEEMLIPSLLVQPFVENAVWHGLAPKEGAKELIVRFIVQGEGVQCRIQDNGIGRSEKTTTGRRSLGLKLTGERLQLLTERMEKEGAFVIEDLKDERGTALGTLVVLKLAGTSA